MPIKQSSFRKAWDHADRLGTPGATTRDTQGLATAAEPSSEIA